jgi:hypothetical protein
MVTLGIIKKGTLSRTCHRGVAGHQQQEGVGRQLVQRDVPRLELVPDHLAYQLQEGRQGQAAANNFACQLQAAPVAGSRSQS